MKLIPLCLFIITVFLFSCEKSPDSDLRGRWQLKTEVSANNTTTQVDSIFYGFDNNVVSVQKVERPTYTKLVFGKYTQTSDSLFFDYLDWDGSHDYFLKKKIIYSKSEHYLILKLNSNTMNLKSKDRELIFHKF
ncbi:MAG: lipocalin-like domain-containing protein [Bacteroidales bacterium]